MPRNRPKYRRSLRACSLARLALFGLMAMAVGVTVVYVRTQSVARGNEKQAYEREILQLQNDLLSLDQKWVASKERYMIRGQHGVMRLPTETGSVIGMVAAIVGGGVFTIVAGSVAPPMAIFGVGVVVIGIVSSLSGCLSPG